MKHLRLQLVKHMVAATVFFGVCTMVIQVSVLTVDVPLDALGLFPDGNDQYSRGAVVSRSLVALSLAFYFSRKALSGFDRFLDERRSKLIAHSKP
jgi:hypothetical protein